MEELTLDLIRGEAAAAGFSALLDRAFPVPQGRRFFDDFPFWDPALGPEPATGRAERFGAFARGELVASAGVRLAKFAGSAQAGTKLALVGAVATDAAWRERGLASRLVEACVEWAATRGASEVVLWGSETEFYARLGFHPRGKQVRIPIAELDLQSACEITPARGWVDGIFDLLRSRKRGLALEPGDLRWMRAHAGVEWFYLGVPARPSACVALGRGIDLGGFVHEWAGHDDEVHALLRALQTARPEVCLLGTPETLPSAAIAASGSWVVEPLCLSRPLGARPAQVAPGDAEIDDAIDLWGLDAV